MLAGRAGDGLHLLFNRKRRQRVFEVSLVLGLLIGNASAEDLVFRPASHAETTALGISLGRPLVSEMEPAPDTAPAPLPRFVRAKFQDEPREMIAGAGLGSLEAATLPQPLSRINQPEATQDSFAPPAPTPLISLSPSDSVNPWTGTHDEGAALDSAESFHDGSFEIAQPRRYVYGQAEYLLWWLRGARLPPLVTTSPATTPQASQGVLGVNGTTILYGSARQPDDAYSGARFTLGGWIDSCNTLAVEGNYFFVAQQNPSFSTNSIANPVIARPIYDDFLGANTRQLTTTPGTNAGDVFKLLGGIHVDNPSDLQGAELNLKYVVCEGCNYRLYVLAGFRYLDLSEGLHIVEDVASEQSVVGAPIFNAGNHIQVFDSFDTRNQFYGGQVGSAFEWRHGPWSVEANWKLALGSTVESIDIQGSQVVTTPAGARSTFVGGLLAVPSNIGNHTSSQFSIVPEAGLKVSYQFTEHLRAYLGYDFLYWTNVVRPGDQVDTRIDVRQVPNFVIPPMPVSNPTHPIVPNVLSGFWAMGMNAGFEIRY